MQAGLLPDGGGGRHLARREEAKSYGGRTGVGQECRCDHLGNRPFASTEGKHLCIFATPFSGIWGTTSSKLTAHGICTELLHARDLVAVELQLSLYAAGKSNRIFVPGASPLV